MLRWRTFASSPPRLSGHPDGFADHYRAAQPRLRDRTGRTVEFSFSDLPLPDMMDFVGADGMIDDQALADFSAGVDGYRAFEVSITHPVLDPADMSIHEVTGIAYVIYDMERAH